MSQSYEIITPCYFYILNYLSPLFFPLSLMTVLISLIIRSIYNLTESSRIGRAQILYFILHVKLVWVFRFIARKLFYIFNKL